MTASQLRFGSVFPKRTQLGHIGLIRDGHVASADVPIAQASRTFGGRAGEAADPDRRSRPLHWFRCQTRVFNLKIFSFIRDGFALPQAANDLQSLVGTTPTLFARDAEPGKFLDAIADSYP